MNFQNTLSIWHVIAIIFVGVGSLVLLGIQPGPTTATVTLATMGTPVANPDQATALPQSLATLPTLVLFTPAPAPTPTSTVTPIPPLVLPEAPVPTGGQSFLLLPSGPDMVGWAQAEDEAINHFGDYNIYAGVFGGKQHVGAVQFDLSTIPPGSPILYADLTLTGLSTQWLGTEGQWSAQMLAEWMDPDWSTRDFHWLARADSGSVLLQGAAASADLGIGTFNTFYLPPEGIDLLKARLFTKAVSFRLLGPTSGADNLFAWDSGFGVGSTARAPVLRIITGGPAPADPPPSPTPDYVVVTLTPMDEYALFALAAERMTATAQATPNAEGATPVATATPTALPPNWVTPVISVNTPVPENNATAVWQAQIATAEAVVQGTPTATPPNVWTATSTPLPPPPTATPIIVAYNLLTPTALPTPTPGAIPGLLHGKILFYTDRNGGESLMLMNPDGSNLAVWTGGPPDWVYAQAQRTANLAPDGQARVIVSSEQVRNSQLWIVDSASGARRQLTDFNQIAYDPVWSPAGNTIAFVSPEPGNDELFLINTDGSGLRQLTANDWEWDKHPSWSPDGSRIVFWSNRETRRQQIWIMNADGTNLQNLSNNPYNDWDPVWVR